MTTLRLGQGLLAVTLATALVACGAQSGAERERQEDVGELAAALPAAGGSSGTPATYHDEIMAVSEEGQLFGHYNTSGPLVQRPIPLGTGMRAAHGWGNGNEGDAKYERYIDGTGNAYERTKLEGAGSGWHAIPADGGVKLVDITGRRHGKALAVTEEGKIMKRFDSAAGPKFSYDAYYRVKIAGVGPERMVSRIDVCSNGDVLAASKDNLNLYRLQESSGLWDVVSLAKFPGDAAKAPRVLDVACGNPDYENPAIQQMVVGYRQGEGPSLYELEETSQGVIKKWVPWYYGSPFGFVTRVDVDGSGDVFFVAADYFNGTKLWRKRCATCDQSIIVMSGTPLDVGI
jgi:hypothetical protein